MPMVRPLAQHIGETIYFLEGDGYFVASYSPSFRYLGFSETELPVFGVLGNPYTAGPMLIR